MTTRASYGLPLHLRDGKLSEGNVWEWVEDVMHHGYECSGRPLPMRQCSTMTALRADQAAREKPAIFKLVETRAVTSSAPRGYG